MNEQPIHLKSEKFLVDLIEAVEGPLPLNIVEVEYQPDSDRFLTTFDIGVFQFQTLLVLDSLEALVDGLHSLKNQEKKG